MPTRSRNRSAQIIAFQGERGSNSHMATVAMLGAATELMPCALSAQVVEALLSGRADAAVLPIENTLHGSVAEHYDLLLANPIRIDGESLLRIHHNLIAAPGVQRADIRRILSHPVALSQCRKFLAAEPHAQAEPFYDTAGSVKHIMEQNLRDTAGIAPALAAEVYGAEVLVKGIEDNAENFTRFHLLRREAGSPSAENLANKMSLAFAVQHRPGSLVAALQLIADAGADLTKIESRPVPGSPWEYVFFVDLRFAGQQQADAVLTSLRNHCRMVKELGRYAAVIDR